MGCHDRPPPRGCASRRPSRHEQSQRSSSYLLSVLCSIGNPNLLLGLAGMSPRQELDHSTRMAVVKMYVVVITVIGGDDAGVETPTWHVETQNLASLSNCPPSWT